MLLALAHSQLGNQLPELACGRMQPRYQGERQGVPVLTTISAAPSIYIKHEQTLQAGACACMCDHGER